MIKQGIGECLAICQIVGKSRGVLYWTWGPSLFVIKCMGPVISQYYMYSPIQTWLDMNTNSQYHQVYLFSCLMKFKSNEIEQNLKKKSG